MEFTRQRQKTYNVINYMEYYKIRNAMGKWGRVNRIRRAIGYERAILRRFLRTGEVSLRR